MVEPVAGEVAGGEFGAGADRAEEGSGLAVFWAADKQGGDAAVLVWHVECPGVHVRPLGDGIARPALQLVALDHFPRPAVDRGRGEVPRLAGLKQFLEFVLGVVGVVEVPVERSPHVPHGHDLVLVVDHRLFLPALSVLARAAPVTFTQAVAAFPDFQDASRMYRFALFLGPDREIVLAPVSFEKGAGQPAAEPVVGVEVIQLLGVPAAERVCVGAADSGGDLGGAGGVRV